AAELPGLGQLRHEVDVFVVLDQAIVDQRADLERGPVAEDVGDQARDVALQRLDIGIAVRRLAGELAGSRIHGAVGLAAAPGGDEQEERSEEAWQVGPPHHDQRGWPGVGDAGAAGAVGADSAGADPAGAGATAGAGAGSRTTELARSPPRIASVNDVIVKTTAMPVVILPSSVSAFSALTLPPYRIRTVCAISFDESSDRSPRRYACTSAACAGVALTPVPIAHTGS